MEQPQAWPTTLIETIRHFTDADACMDFMVRLRWPNRVIVCPHCGRNDPRYLANARVWECRNKHPRKKFSLKTGTIFEDSPIGFDKWLPAMWMLANDKNGISSYELARALGVTQKTGWFMLSRIRLAMQQGSFELSGEVEVDETFIGGKARNMHINRRQTKIKGTGGTGKAIVLGLLERHGKVQTVVVPTTKRGSLEPHVRAGVSAGATVYTDALKSYNGLDADYVHHVIAHAERYVDGHVHTNHIENFWALLKRALGGTYISVEPFHLHRYLAEEAFRFNEREGSDLGRFVKVVSAVEGKRLTYKKLTGKTDLDSLRGAESVGA